MKTKHAKFEDLNGRNHDLYAVRSLGRGRGFGVLNTLSNVFVSSQEETRDEAERTLVEIEAQGLQSK